MKLPLEGACRCGAVHIRVTEAPIMTAVCHCRGCQRMAASAFSLTAIVPSAAFEVTKGEAVIGGLHREDLKHFFCGYCMTWMFTRPSLLPDFVNLRPTMFDDHSWFTPFLETYASTKLPWVNTGATHSFSEFPPMESFAGLMKEFATSRDTSP